MFTLHFYQVG